MPFSFFFFTMNEINVIFFLFLFRDSSGPHVEIGTASSVYSTKNKEKLLEDTFIRIELKDIGFFAIFDGHLGSNTSHRARDILKKYMIDYINQHNDYEIEKRLRIYLATIESQLMIEYTNSIDGPIEQRIYSGTTCTAVFIKNDALIVAYVGDSRLVICYINGKIDSTIDHNHLDENEVKRIRETGGFVGYNGIINNHLPITRTFGDFLLKFNGEGFIATPSMLARSLNLDKMRFIILASRGLWKTITNQSAVDLVNSCFRTDDDFGAKRLAELAIKNGSNSNITVMIVVFKDGRFVIGQWK